MRRWISREYYWWKQCVKEKQPRIWLILLSIKIELMQHIFKVIHGLMILKINSQKMKVKLKKDFSYQTIVKQTLIVCIWQMMRGSLDQICWWIITMLWSRRSWILLLYHVDTIQTLGGQGKTWRRNPRHRMIASQNMTSQNVNNRYWNTLM